MKANIDVVPNKDGDGWDVVREARKRASSRHDTQAEAIQAGTKAAIQDKVEILIHGRNGQIRARNSFGNDPRRTKG